MEFHPGMKLVPVYDEVSLAVYTVSPGWTHLCQKDKDEISP